MSHPAHSTYVAEIPVHNAAKMAEFQEVMNRAHDELKDHIQGMADELGISWIDAGGIYQLRTRSRWSQELENRLISAYKAGHGNTIYINGEEEDRLRELGF